MSSRGYNNRNPRRRRRRITGRFYAFLTVVVVLCVMVGVFINSRGKANRAGGSFQPSQQIASNLNVTAQITPQPDAGSAGQTTPADAAGTTGGADSEPASDSGVSTITEMIENNDDLEPLVGSEKVDVSDYSVTEGLPGEWRNILLLGSDTRNIKKVSRTDTIIIASINTNDGRIKLTSIMRDMIIPIPGHGERKINSASYYGGVELTMKLINQYFKMNITEYVLVNFSSFQKIVDILGGIELDVTQEEMQRINKSIAEQAKVGGYDQEWFLANRESLELKTFGPDTHLTGIQALGYARIRKIDSDYQRTARQRAVLNAVLQKVKKDAGAVQFMQLASSMWEYVVTNVNMLSAVGLATSVIKNGVGDIIEWRIPGSGTSTSDTRSAGQALYDVDYEENAARLYKFIYES